MQNTITYETASEFHEGCYQLSMQGAAFTANGSTLTITITGY